MRAADKTCLRLFFIHDICSGNFITNQKKERRKCHDQNEKSDYQSAEVPDMSSDRRIQKQGKRRRE